MYNRSPDKCAERINAVMSLLERRKQVLDAPDRSRLELAAQLLDTIRRNTKLWKLQPRQIEDIFATTFLSIEAIVKEVESTYKWERSDMEAVMDKLAVLKFRLPPTLKIASSVRNDSDQRKKAEMTTDQNLDKIIGMTTKDLVTVAAEILSGWAKKVDNFTFSSEMAQQLVRIVSKHHPIVAYHNFTHSVNSLLVFRLLIERGASNRLDPLTIFFAGLGLLSQGLCHYEITPDFLQKTRYVQSVQYSFTSVQAKLSLHQLNRLLEAHQQLNPFEMLPKEEKDKAKRILSLSLLATDQSNHTRFVQQFDKYSLISSLTVGTKQECQPLNCLKKESFLILCVHTSQITKCIGSYEVFLQWEQLCFVERLQQRELYQQFKLEYTIKFKQSDFQQHLKTEVIQRGQEVQVCWQVLGRELPLEDEKNRIRQNMLKVIQSTKRSLTTRKLPNGGGVHSNSLKKMNSIVGSRSMVA